MVPWAHPRQPSKRHLDRFSRFAGHMRVTNKHTDRQTMLLTTSVAIGRISCTECVQCVLKPLSHEIRLESYSLHKNCSGVFTWLKLRALLPRREEELCIMLSILLVA